jgi:predicted PurR-regulated permease PerM
MISYQGKNCVAQLSCALVLCYLCTILLCKLHVYIYMNTNCSDVLAIWVLSLCLVVLLLANGLASNMLNYLVLISGPRIYSEM